MTGRPMATADEALDFARSFMGEGPQRFIDWYPASYGTPWCCIFQSYVLTFSGAQDTHYAWVSGLFDAMRAQGRTFAPFAAQPGDLVAFDYDGGGRNNYDHIAMVEFVGTDDGGAFLVCVDGNWGNRVTRVKRYFGRDGYGGGIAEIARPFYSTPAPPPPPSPSRSFPTDEVPVRRFIRAQSRPEVYLTDAGCLAKRHCTDVDRVKDFAYACRASGVPVLDPPEGATVEIVGDEKIWVVGDAFADSIPTIG